MLKLVNIKKDYALADTTVHALKGVSLEFRKNEFVSILGQSGCGKTTLLNIIGGLDKYTSGDLIINGKSTKQYKDRDWDTYRNHSIGFVFQSYNLIPHQTVLENVELALTLSGISKAERLKRATAVLTKVGLADKLKSKPNQLSGGQMQRVAIARALINDPEILLADEPTGALDSKTSTQIMDLLKEISNDRLIIMVTHNPDLAEEYSSRTIKLLDGKVIDDSNPYDSKKDEESQEEKGEEVKSTEDKPKSTGIKKSTSSKTKKTSMSFFTALSLSLKNLLTKKARTFMVSFAGSIGIIGIALILSLSSGFQAYIDSVQKDTLSSYPVSITNASSNTSSLLNSMMEANGGSLDHDLDKVYENDMLVSMFSDIASSIHTNDLKSFKAYLDSHEEIDNYTTAIKYSYDLDIHTYYNGKLINPSETVAEAFTKVGQTLGGSYVDTFKSLASSMNTMTGNIFEEMIDNETLVHEQYNLVDGRWPSAYNELVLVVDKNNEIFDYILYSLNLKENSLYNDLMVSLVESLTDKTLAQVKADYESDPTSLPFDPSDLVEIKENEKIDYSVILEDFDYKLVLPTDYYTFDADATVPAVKKSETAINQMIAAAPSLKIVGIIKPNPDAAAHSINGTIAYTTDLTKHYADAINGKDIVSWQKAHKTTDVFSGKPFNITATNAKTAISTYLATPEGQADTNKMMLGYVLTLEADVTPKNPMQPDGDKYTQTEIDNMLVYMFSLLPTSVRGEYVAIDDDGNPRTYNQNLKELNVVSLDTPSGISIYPVDFESKDRIIQIIKDYNKMVTEDPDKGEAYIIEYTDYIGVMMSGITDIINAITYILIAFVAVSLIVSSIMIAIITYISVLERTKEIGILRAMGASKRDVSRIFNAETFLIGLTAGLFGVGITVLLNIPINMVISALSGLNGVASLPVLGGIALVVISVALSMIAGLIPSRIASKKDPVIALRTE